MTPTHLRVLNSGTLTEADLARWRELSGAAVEPNPYLDPRYCAPLLPLLERAGVLVVVAEDGDSWAAAIAVAPVKARLLGSSHRVLTTGGPVIDHLYRTHPLARAGSAASDLAALISGLRTLRLGGVLHLDDFFSDGPFASAISDAAAQLRAPTLVDGRGYQGYASRTSATPQTDHDVYGPAHMSKSRRNKLRRNWRALQERTGSDVTYVNLGADLSALRDFISLQERGWKGDATRGGRALGLDKARVRAIEDALAASASDGSMFVGALRAGGESVYMVIAMRDGDRLVCDVLDAYDERYRDLSAGTLGRLAHLAYVRHTWPDADFDPAVRSSAGDVASIYPESRPTAGMHLAFGSVGARTLIRAAVNVRRRRERKESVVPT